MTENEDEDEDDNVNNRIQIIWTPRRRREVYAYGSREKLEVDIKKANALREQYSDRFQKIEIFQNHEDIERYIENYINNSADWEETIPNIYGQEVKLLEAFSEEESFCFLSTDRVHDTLQLSNMAAFMFKRGFKRGIEKTSSLTPDLIKLGEKVRIQNADDHARKMFDVIKNNKDITTKTSSWQVAKMLNESKIPTARGGEWHNKTVINLYNRWEKLGLKPPTPEK